MTKKIVLPILVLAVSTAAIFSVVNTAHAQTNSVSPFSGLAQAIAQKFNLDPTQVQAVFDQYRQAHMHSKKQNFQNNLQNRLTTLVQEGKITDSQKQAINDELNKIKAEGQKSSQDRQSEFKTWAQSQGIDPTLIPMFGGRHIRMTKLNK